MYFSMRLGRNYENNKTSELKKEKTGVLKQNASDFIMRMNVTDWKSMILRIYSLKEIVRAYT